MARKWKDIVEARHGKGSYGRVSQAAREANAREDLEYDLQALRELVGKTQVEVAEALGASQSQISVAERRPDHLVSTLRRYVTALGGELEIVARFGDKTVKLRGV